jgi:hypothetical protein
MQRIHEETMMKNQWWLGVRIVFGLAFMFMMIVYPAQAGSLELVQLRVAPLAILQNNAHSYTVEVSWNPEYHFNPNWFIGANVGWAPIETFGNESNFNLFEYQGVLGHRFSSIPIGLEFGAGLQRWQYAGTHLLLSGNGFYQFSKKLFGVLDRVFVGYSNFSLPNITTQEVKFGVGFRF